MKNSITVKFIAVLLCAVALLGMAASGIGFLCLGATDLLSGKSFEQVAENSMNQERERAADEIVRSWASSTLGGVPEAVTDYRLENALSYSFDTDRLYYTITDDNGNTLFTTYAGEEYAECYDITVRDAYYEKVWEPAYPEVVLGPAPKEAMSEDSISFSDSTAEAAAVYDMPEDLRSREVYTNRGRVSYQYTPAYYDHTNVRLYLAEGAEVLDPIWTVVRVFWQYRYTMVTILALSFLVFAMMAVYLCASAGHGPGAQAIRASGLNAMPLDLYGLLFVGYLVFGALFLDEMGHWLLRQEIRVIFVICLGGGFLGCLLFVGLCFAVAAQVKTPDRFWLRNTLCWRCLLGFWNLIAFLLKQIPRALALAKRVVLGCLDLLRRTVAALVKAILKRLERLYARLPLMWQWLAAGGAMVLVLTVGFASNSPLLFLAALVLWLVLVLYGANAFGILLEAARKMRGGNLEAQVHDKHLVGSFRQFAHELNGLADVAIVAAQRELKSERMKTELITNVSHDIKTPLTSIINYVDLLAKPHSPEEEQAYLEVLSRQSARMKKLIEDLIEMSKATTGNIPVEISTLDAVESVNQALGEFTDKLERAGLVPVFRQPPEPIPMLADGRLFWRAMSNLLSNAVKYAMPGTRLYVDVSEAEEKVIISLKNISRAELNVSADELLERFVRGDTARNTEGSGLGLNIAQSLMELQKGELRLLVDGDLFKVTLIFPKAPNAEEKELIP